MVIGFTGKITYPTVNQVGKRFEIAYRAGARQARNGEDVSLDMEAHERTNGSYDVWVMGKLVANAERFSDATETMNNYINLTTGKLKDGGLEKSVGESAK